MSLEAAIYARLSAVSGVTSLVGSTNPRIFPAAMPQWSDQKTKEFGGPYPAIVWRRVVGASDAHLTARSNIAESTVQIDCYAESPLGAANLGAAVNSALHAYRGLVGSQFISVCLERSRRTDYYPADDGSDSAVYVSSHDFDFFYQET